MKKLLLLISLALVYGCAGSSELVYREIGDSSNNKKVLISIESSDYKNMLLEEILAGLDNSIYIKIIDSKNIEKESTEDYNAVLIISVKRVFNISIKVRNFVKNAEEKDKIIIYFTEMGSSRIPKALEEVDAISSASEQWNIKQIKEYILQEIQARL